MKNESITFLTEKETAELLGVDEVKLDEFVEEYSLPCIEISNFEKYGILRRFVKQNVLQWKELHLQETLKKMEVDEKKWEQYQKMTKEEKELFDEEEAKKEMEHLSKLAESGELLTEKQLAVMFRTSVKKFVELVLNRNWWTVQTAISPGGKETTFYYKKEVLDFLCGCEKNKLSA